MDLPALDWQFLYGRLSWSIVLATTVALLLPPALRQSRRVVLGLLAMACLVMALPNEASPAYWLVLAFQWPSGVLLGLCLLTLSRAWPGAGDVTPMPAGLAAVIAITGTALYLDAIGLLSLGMYYWGFGPFAAPLVALAAIAGCALAAVLGRARPHALVAVGALALFSVLRLPTGNPWDALLDPLLWGWAVGSLGIRGVLWIARKVRGTQPRIAPAAAAGTERFQ
ncbi:hypothetical protein [Massilia soli]|uniref:Uncharacterized protein n=1 Tax=Massilia soli TaxID=2792854 RepID=A0ABS7SN85_9BURK|nr:hypothetical protein [Massilia soli]MBZ2206610.1 hypothetical protein [Massilia soli]